MKALIIDNIILYKNGNKYYSPAIYSDSFFDRYLSVFSSIRIVAKIVYVEQVKNLIPLDTERIEIVEIPYYRGIKELALRLLSVIKCYKEIENGCDCSILKVVQLESIFAVLFGRLKKPYGVEVVNDPKSLDDSNILVKIVSIFAMKYFVRYAKGVSYITKYVLQEKYPCYGMTKKGKEDGYIYTDYPTIDLFMDYDLEPRKYGNALNRIELLHVSNVIRNDSKGHSTVLRIVKDLNDKGIDVHVIFVGEGEYVQTLMQMVHEWNVEKCVDFVGRISDRRQLMAYYKKADLFVFPSHSEGQGRVNLEAQSVGLPCLASNVGGIIELFDDKYLFDPLDHKGFAEMIAYLMNHPKELEDMSKKNIESAYRFEYSLAKEKREAFYKAILNFSKEK